MQSHSRALFAVAALFAFLLVPSSAMAAKPVNDFFGTVGNGNGQFNVPVGGLAVNQASGDLYVFDQANSRVQRFDEDGNYLSQFGEAGSGDGQFNPADGVGLALFPPAQIAIDQADGSIYVADPGNNRVQKFEEDGSFDLVIDTATGSPVSETFSEPKGVAVGTDGTLYVADTGNNRIVKFDSSGAYLSDLSIPVGGEEGELSRPAGLAIDSTGAIYVFETQEVEGRVQKFNATGAFELALSPGEPLRGVATDTTNDHVFVSARNDIYEFDATGALQDTHHVDPSGAVLSFMSLAVNDEGGPVYGANLNGGSPNQDGTWILILDEPGIPAPTAMIDPVTTFDSDSASLSGEVNPNGNIDANWRFQVSVDGGSTWRDVGTGGTVSEGTVAEGVSTEATGLEPNTEYQVRLVASKFFVTDQGIDSASFTTDPVPPVVSALDPGPVTDTTAWLGGYVNPRNALTTFYIEYSTDPGFASSVSVPASQDAPVGSGAALTLATQLVKGLQPQTTYRYRVVATSAGGTTTGESRSFTTTATPTSAPAIGLPDGRVWEKVSPAYKAGADIRGGNAQGAPNLAELSRAAVDGNTVAFGSRGKFGGEGGPAVSQYLAQRGPSGWSTEGISLPMNPTDYEKSFSPIYNFSFYSWLSRDLRKGISATTRVALNPGDPANAFNLYLRDFEASKTVTVSDGDASTFPDTRFVLEGVSPDETRYFFSEEFEEELGGIDKFGPIMERTSSGALRMVSVLPNGTAVRGYLGSKNERLRAPGFNPISADSTRVYFATGLGNAPNYVRENGTNTTLVSASERTGDDPDTPRNAEFVAASTDGKVAFFTSPAILTDDSTPDPTPKDPSDGSNLYRWEAEAPVGERLTDLTSGDPKGARVRGVAGVSDDGEAIYFVADGDLATGASNSRPNLYLWRNGEGVRLIATLDPGLDVGLWERQLLPGGGPTGGNTNYPSTADVYRAARVTPDGSRIVFASSRPQTSYDTNGHQGIYIYDSETDRVSCISCGSVEPKSKGASWFFSCTGPGRNEVVECQGTPYLPRNFRDDGKRLFFDSKDALVPEDTNGAIDVYEWQEGALRLLSSGTSGLPSRFVDASGSGDDVFFTTAQRLTASDQDDLRDLYDARVGGRPEPAIKKPCVADECQGTPPAAPAFQSPSSAGFKGAGNPRKGKPRCRKGNVRRKGRCVKRKARKQATNRRANENRRAGR